MMVQLCGVRYTIGFYKEHETANTDHGFSQCWKQHMGILDNMPRDMTTKVIIHEIIEQINDQLEIGLLHPQITQLETGIHDMLMHSPDIIERYLDQEEEDDPNTDNTGDL